MASIILLWAVGSAVVYLLCAGVITVLEAIFEWFRRWIT